MKLDYLLGACLLGLLIAACVPAKEATSQEVPDPRSETANRVDLGKVGSFDLTAVDYPKLGLRCVVAENSYDYNGGLSCVPLNLAEAATR